MTLLVLALASVLAGDWAPGRALFLENCAACHGTEGDGRGPFAPYLFPPPRDFTSEEIRVRSTPAGAAPTRDDVATTILRGIPGTGMPSFPNLSPEERRSIADHLLSLRKADPAAPVGPMPKSFSADPVASGKDAYEKARCDLCHGAEGKGDGPITTALAAEWGSPHLARDLTKGALYEGGSTAEDVYRTLTTGMPGTPMTSYAGILTDAERGDLARYVASIAGRTVPRSARVDEGVSAKRGAWVFLGRGRCLSCHKVGGAGHGTRGPDLTAFAAEAPARREGVSAAEYAVESILDPSAFVVPGYGDDVMPPVNEETIFLEPDDVRSLAVFLLGAREEKTLEEIDRAVASRWKKENRRPEAAAGDPARGRDLYLDKNVGCASCHVLLGHGGGDVGPDLTDVGPIQSRRQLRRSTVEPNAAIARGYERLGVETTDGDVFVGFPLGSFGGETRIRDGTRVRSFPPDEIAERYENLDSSMPGNLGEILGEAADRAVADLVEFLKSPRPVLQPAPPGPVERIASPLARTKPGPPLGGLLAKTNVGFLRAALADPKAWTKSAKMPDLGLTDDEIEDVVAFLATLPGGRIETQEWPAWAEKGEDDLSDAEFGDAEEVRARGKAVFQTARCRLCHALGGSGGEAGLAVAFDGLAAKARRDWLDAWISDPAALHPHTLMPRFRLSAGERRDLVLYLSTDVEFLRDGAPLDARPARTDPESARRGRSTVERFRCVVCHDIPGLDVTPPPPHATDPDEPFVAIASDARCLSCHAIDGRGGTYAPDLGNAGRRLRRAWVEKFVAAPDVVRLLSQQMPRLHLSPEEAAITADFVERRLVSGDAGDLASPGDPERGRALYAEKGCRACHQLGTEGGALGPELTRAGERLKPGAVVDLLLDPQRFFPSVPKPRIGLTQREAEAIAAFLDTLGRDDAGRNGERK